MLKIKSFLAPFIKIITMFNLISKLLRNCGLLIICYSITFLIINYINGNTNEWGTTSKILMHIIAIAAFLFFSESNENEITFSMLIWGFLKGFITLIGLSLLCKAFSLSLPFYYIALGIAMITTSK